MEKPFILIQGPVATRSGYGSHARDLCIELLKSDKYDIKIVSRRWGNTPMNALRNDVEDHKLIIDNLQVGNNLPKQPDLHIDITVPNEFQAIGKKNMGITAGLEATVIPKHWVDGLNRMDKIVVPSKFVKDVCTSTTFDEKQGDINLTDTEIKPVLVDTSPYKKLLEKSEELFVEKEYVAARLTASNLALDQSVPESIRKAARGIAVEVGKFLTFSPLVLESDPFSIRYEVKTGDNLTSIRNQNNLKIPYGLIRRINNLNNSDIFPGQTLKLLKGPFHVIIEKKNYRMDIIQGDKDSQVLVASYPVGLGEYNSTPIGLFAVDGDKRIKDPSWTNPRTGEFMSASDPKNPVGEYYIGLKGLEERTKDLDNYAIHGTIEPDSIGTDSSMGCIRLHSDIIPIVFDMLYGTSSTVEVIGK